jgi:glycosyltransferase involved in cell wall biosynthesis
MMKVAIVTPTIGSEHLSDCLKSVQNQTYENITQYLFVDGKDHHIDVQIESVNYPKVKTVILEENIGKGWYGHRVYAACSFLVNADVICYLDEDNWYDADHVEKLVEVINRGNDWAYSLRKITDKHGNFICNDNCESLGKWPVYFDEKVFHIDTSSFAVKRDVAVRVGHSWYGQWGADRQFFHTLSKHFKKFGCTNEPTLNYRLDGNENSVKEQFFIEGNEVNLKKYGDKFPWNEKEKIISYLGPNIVLVE